MADQKQPPPPDATPPLTEQKIPLSHGMDQAAEYLAQSTGYAALSPEAERRMLRKMDWILIPMVSRLCPFETDRSIQLTAAAVSHRDSRCC